MAKKLWGGRFKKKTDPFFEKFSSSLATDYRLAKYDLIGSFLHIHVLHAAKLLSKKEFLSLKRAIKALLSRGRKGLLKFPAQAEDVHTAVQNMLEKKAGKAVEKLQTCRSRNDQVAFDTRFYCLEHAVGLHHMLLGLNKGLAALAGQHAGLVIPGYTHLQHAQVVYFKDYLSAHEAMFVEDGARLECFSGRLQLTLGSGALAGTPIPAAVYKAQCKKAMKELGLADPLFEVQPPKNSLVNVSDRDFVIELLSVLAILGMHISRLCEDLILWSTREFGFIEIGDEYCTGSSLMPQKKNPDALELLRGSAGLLYGNLVSVLTTMKGLPLSYNRDMQWDKSPLFSSLELVEESLVVLCGLLKTVKVNKSNIEKQLKDESLCATDLADYLVSRGVAFQEAHEVIGRLVQSALKTGKKIKDMPQAELDKFSKNLDKKEVLKRLDPKFCASLKRSVNRI